MTEILSKSKEYLKKTVLSKKLVVPIKQCVHYCGFRYGLGDYNPYETYITGLHEKKGDVEINERFLQFLKYYRPTHFGEALGVLLSKVYPLWQYPWASKFDPSYNAFDMEPSLIPDIITHFSKKGIPVKIIENEFAALKAAYHSIANEGYQPHKYGYAEVLCLKNGEKTSFILLDGNHRVGALSALGFKHVEALLYMRNVINRKDVKKWPGVKNGFYTEEDALKIFDVYFSGNHAYETTKVPASVIF
jgi:hypothetical protein